MAIFQTSFQMQKVYQIGEPVIVTFKLTNVSTSEYKIVKWGAPFDGMGGPYFSLLRNGEAVAYDGPYIFWDTPTEESLLTIASGETVSAELALTDLFSLARQSSYTLDFSGCIQVQTSSGWSIVSDENIVSQPSTFDLLAGALPALLTVGQKERAREKDAAASRPPVAKTPGDPCKPNVIAPTEDVEKKTL